jgi:hypothetical protein
MSSYLDKQQAAFKSEAMSVAPKIAAKRSLAPPVAENAPSPAPSNASNTSRNENKEIKRKREPQNVVYSQPAATGYGTEAFTQVTYVIDFLKKKDEPKTFREILEYLSQVNADEKTQKLIAGILRQHERVRWIPDSELKTVEWASGTFMHRPIINVRTKKDLIAYLQNKADAQGVSVKDLKDGWPDCEEAIDELEDEHTMLEWFGAMILHCFTKSTSSSRICGVRQSFRVSMNSSASSRKQVRSPPVKTQASASRLLQRQRRRRERVRERVARLRTLIWRISSRTSPT